MANTGPHITPIVDTGLTLILVGAAILTATRYRKN